MEGSLPPGWTEHRAPNGIPYYWNAELKKSTYKRPAWPDEQGKASGSIHLKQEDINTLTETPVAENNDEKRKVDREHRKQSFDRPKYKKLIPGSDIWVIVTTKRNRFFFHNTETHESTWMPPQELLSIISTLGLPKRKLKKEFQANATELTAGDENNDGEGGLNEHPGSPQLAMSPSEDEDEEADSVEEEVIETEPEEDDQSDNDENENIEFGEEDLLFQLQELEGKNQENTSLSEKEEPVVDHETAVQIFRELLKDKDVDVYRTWEFTYPKLLDDERFLVLGSGQERRQVFEDYCKSAIASKPVGAPKVSSLSSFWGLLQSLPNTLLWPEFKRKYRKSPILSIPRYSERDLEKLFREFQILRNRSLEDRLYNFQNLCRSRNVNPKRPDTYTDKILNDVRYAVIFPEELHSWLVSNVPS
ncbi:DNA replication protein Dre4 [Schizosaccharomyces cryophilus OY26]|uniref:DNA replication protein Dre4 n=1 Tax=Schizosaccharomyces cryophilus (strain OY26 / ATCC MYA-4695 / CBS 11777 / NBRC 106824 / NRRL Y48691) TaxID=653667 RepID=S9VU18_SCHCR|nr:DNA replication protein Dre4 [Schizosaccharomyces cryophilus OY26]EPY49679.1 DNA replication protein Dre4 [Schizosaccharomyces cryophilus OY26]